MITIDIYRTKQNLIRAYKVLGHAEDAPEGQSIICAWVSAVTQMALIGLENELKQPLTYRTEAEEGLLEVTLQGVPNERTQILLGSMVDTLWQLVESFPQDVCVFEHRG